MMLGASFGRFHYLTCTVLLIAIFIEVITVNMKHHAALHTVTSHGGRSVVLEGGGGNVVWQAVR